MKKVILCSLLLFLSGCGLFKSNEPTKIEVAQIDANNVVDSFFKEYKPIKESEIITTKYVIYVFSISDNSYNQNIDNMLLEKISKNGWRLVVDDNGKKIYCDLNNNILETVAPYLVTKQRLNGIVASQSENLWRGGYSYRDGGNIACK